MMALLNLLFPLIFIFSIVMIVYCIALFFGRKSKQSKVRAIKLIIIPILYIIGALIYSKHKLVENKNDSIKELSGNYIYQDSSMERSIKITLFDNKTFIFDNSSIQDSIIKGNWDLDDYLTGIKFIDQKGELLTQGYKKSSGDTSFIILNDSKSKLSFRKTK